MLRLMALLLTAAALVFGQDSSAHRSRLQDKALPIPPPSLLLKQPPRLSPKSPAVVMHGRRDKKVIALTFDACSTRTPSRYDDRITKILVETQTPATLFLGGKWMEEEVEQTKYLAGIPYFEIGNHTFLHPHLPTMSDDRIRQELIRTQRVMYALTGRQPMLFRPPYGEYDERVIRIAASIGLTTIQFDLPSGDPDSSITKQQLVEYVTSMARNGSIIVMHINQRGWHTAEALPEIIARLRKRGFTFATVSQLLSRGHSPETVNEKARE